MPDNWWRLYPWRVYIDSVITYAPLALGAIVVWTFARRGKAALAILGAALLVLSLWLGVEYWYYGPMICYPARCAPSYYFRQVYDHQAFFFLFGIPLLSALLTYLQVIHHRSAKVGAVIGIVPIAAFWLLLEYWVIDGCRQCEGSLCCEWTGIGVVVFTIAAVLEVVIFLIVASVIAWHNRRRRRLGHIAG